MPAIPRCLTKRGSRSSHSNKFHKSPAAHLASLIPRRLPGSRFSQKRRINEQIWMRGPVLQCEEEFLFCQEVFEYALADLKQLPCKNGIITEGAAYVPQLMNQAGIPDSRYMAITPTEEFQISHFRKRKFVPYVLEGCRDKEKAFENWMGRDVLFAKEVRKQCRQYQYYSIINDGSLGIDELVSRTAVHFGFCD